MPKRLPFATAAAVEMLAGSLVIFAASRLFGEDWSRMAAASPRAWGGVGYLVIFGSLVGFTAFAYCLNELPATTVGTYAYVNPIVAVVLGAAILREPLTPGLLAGGLLILSRSRSTLRKHGSVVPSSRGAASPPATRDPQSRRIPRDPADRCPSGSRRAQLAQAHFLDRVIPGLAQDEAGALAGGEDVPRRFGSLISSQDAAAVSTASASESPA